MQCQLKYVGTVWFYPLSISLVWADTLCFLPDHSFLHYRTCENDILKTNLPVLIQISTRALWAVTRSDHILSPSLSFPVLLSRPHSSPSLCPYPHPPFPFPMPSPPCILFPHPSSNPGKGSGGQEVKGQGQLPPKYVTKIPFGQKSQEVSNSF